MPEKAVTEALIASSASVFPAWQTSATLSPLNGLMTGTVVALCCHRLPIRNGRADSMKNALLPVEPHSASSLDEIPADSIGTCSTSASALSALAIKSSVPQSRMDSSVKAS